MKNTSDYWSKLTNPDNGEKFEYYLGYMFALSNRDFDVDRMLNSEYGAELTRRLDRQYRAELDPMSAETLEYITSCGLRKDLHDAQEYYTRWSVFTPLDMDKGKKYPVVFVLHGGGDSIEAAEYISGYLEIAAREQFIAVYPQNNNADNVVRLLERMKSLYPIDIERVYVAGHSQGGGKTSDCAARYPEYFTAQAPCNNDIFRNRDRWGVYYTEEEIQHMTEALVPFIQVVGCTESGSIVPMYHYDGTRKLGTASVQKKPDGSMEIVQILDKGGNTEPLSEQEQQLAALYYKWEESRSPDPRYWSEKDPNRPDPKEKNPGGIVGPAPGENPHRWKLEQVNRRLATLDIPPLDLEKCREYESAPDSELHHVLGFYGSEEHIDTTLGYKHYVLNMINRAGLPVFRYVAVENCHHTYMLTMGQYTWDFFKQFRRDGDTGKIVFEPYNA